MSDLVGRRVVIRGRVQGVAFRWETRREAERLGVRGWVRNRADGAVEGRFEGPLEAVEALTDWCRRGPAMAAVASVEATPETPRGDSASFTIRR